MELVNHLTRKILNVLASQVQVNTIIINIIIIKIQCIQDRGDEGEEGGGEEGGGELSLLCNPPPHHLVFQLSLHIY